MFQYEDTYEWTVRLLWLMSEPDVDGRSAYPTTVPFARAGVDLQIQVLIQGIEKS